MEGKDFAEIAKLLRDELQVRRDDLDLKRQESKNAHEYALKALEVKAASEDRMAAVWERCNKRKLVAGVSIFLLSVTFAWYCLWSGNKELVVEATKVILYGGTGLVSGRAWGMLKSDRSRSSDE